MSPQGDVQLSIGYWIVSHKQTLRTWWGVSSLTIIAFSLIWMVIFFSVFFSHEKKTNAIVITSLNSAGGFSTNAFQPQNLNVGSTTVIVRDDTHVDVVAEVINPNTEWGAEKVTAHFIINNVAQPAINLFINQGDRRPVIQVNATTASAATATAVLVIDETNWSRASTASLPAASFAVENLQLSPSTITVNGQQRSSVTVSASLTNNSVYNYYRVDIPVVVKSGERIVGVGQVGIDRWPTLSARPLTVTLPYPVIQATSAEIVPQVSRFDLGNTFR